MASIKIYDDDIQNVTSTQAKVYITGGWDLTNRTNTSTK
jgi:hypothetical protein